MSLLNVKKNTGIPYGRQSIDSSDIKAVVEVLKSDWLTQGPTVEVFEKELANVCGSRFAVAVSSGTAALHLACLSAGIKPKDEVIVPSLTFAATANAVVYCGGTPVFADINADTGQLDPDHVQKLITSKTKMVIPMHYAGFPMDLRRLRKMTRSQGIILLEDAAHALGANFLGVPVGSCRYSDMAVLSFHPLKHITTAEGGAVLTNDHKRYEDLKKFRSHGITKVVSQLRNQDEGSWYHEMQVLGYNYRLTDLQSALGLSQLKRLHNFVKYRREIAQAYDDAFKGHSGFTIPKEHKGQYSSFHLYPIRLTGELVKKRKEIFESLRSHGIGVQVHYIPVYWHPYYQDLGFKTGLNPNAEKFYAAEISLPIFPGLKERNVKKVIRVLLQVIKKFQNLHDNQRNDLHEDKAC